MEERPTLPYSMPINKCIRNGGGKVELENHHLSIIIVIRDSGKPQWKTLYKITGLTFQKYRSTKRQRGCRTVPDQGDQRDVTNVRDGPGSEKKNATDRSTVIIGEI